MIINQTTTLIFEYPQDYLQEQEWCKTKEDRWIHKGTDTLGAVYENQISYSIGATADRKTEPTISKMEQVDEPQTAKIIEAYSQGFADGADAVKAMPSTECRMCKHFKDRPNCGWECEYDTFEECKYEPKDEPQTERKDK